MIEQAALCGFGVAKIPTLYLSGNTNAVSTPRMRCIFGIQSARIKVQGIIPCRELSSGIILGIKHNVYPRELKFNHHINFSARIKSRHYAW